MPELPEVETVARGLRLTVLGRRILSVTLRKTDFIDDPSLIERHLPGRRIEAVERYGKFMLLRLSAAQGEENSANARQCSRGVARSLGHDRAHRFYRRRAALGKTYPREFRFRRRTRIALHRRAQIRSAGLFVRGIIARLNSKASVPIRWK